MESRYWPLYGLVLTTPRLELRLPDLELLTGLADAAAQGVHDEAAMPFSVPWSDAPPEERGRSVFQYTLGTIAEWRPERWVLSLAVVHQGEPVGVQGLNGTGFAVTREASTGSWLGLAHQGRGLGTEMRAAVLHLAFAGLGARFMTSSAMTDNPASHRVSEKLGYRPDGLETAGVQGRCRTLRRWRLSREDWEERRTVPVRVQGLESCHQLFGLP
ncbi:GNAT family N-acetyltransferase [Streptomyces orinoci]|uniref:GNAT family protein n=1 Tax=Streptomyces orinoci TaxID=67339 RepID=A0ABV3K570_STRON|nr:GNAT family protein [Streptomyces orinoci]